MLTIESGGFDSGVAGSDAIADCLVFAVCNVTKDCVVSTDRVVACDCIFVVRESCDLAAGIAFIAKKITVKSAVGKLQPT